MRKRDQFQTNVEAADRFRFRIPGLNQYRQTIRRVNPPIEMRKFFLMEVVRGKQKKTNSLKSGLSLRL